MGGEPLDRIENELRLMRELHSQYMRQSEENIRGYRVMASRMFRVVEENSEAIREVREAIREDREATRELREEVRAHTKAILALLDRLDNNGGAAPATG